MEIWYASINRPDGGDMIKLSARGWPCAIPLICDKKFFVVSDLTYCLLPMTKIAGVFSSCQGHGSAIVAYAYPFF